ncbi:MAG TPA: sulfotransferase, partial [Dehalococcoidia bacterium]|nr:sulfotransferase [Dehalococcoidia bacterium]
MTFPQTRTDVSAVADRWPNFFIVGAPRAGTTSLHAYLRKIPSIYLPPIKEINFFSQFSPVEWPIPSIDDENWYRGLFADAGDRPAVGDATPTYLYDEGAAQRIFARIPGAKIIILLRDPIDRAYSHYLMAVNKGWEQRPFYQAVVEDHAAL